MAMNKMFYFVQVGEMKGLLGMAVVLDQKVQRMQPFKRYISRLSILVLKLASPTIILKRIHVGQAIDLIHLPLGHQAVSQQVLP